MDILFEQNIYTRAWRSIRSAMSCTVRSDKAKIAFIAFYQSNERNKMIITKLVYLENQFSEKS